MKSAPRRLHLFSDRTAWDREEAPLARAVTARRAAGLPVLDLTASNPTRCGLPVNASLAALVSPGSLDYDPQAFGQMRAREAVCGYYRQRDAALDPRNICLTASTSEAYSFLFRLLCNPGDEVLIATPSYPLFSYLAALDDVRLVSYPLLYDHGWQIEPGAIESRITPRTRAIVLVHPNNPTGHFTGERERAMLKAICVRHSLALIVDEVFLDYAWPGAPTRSFAVGPARALTFVLSGLSKVGGLPQMKLSWLVIGGPESLREEARARLEVIADTFLSVNAPAQQALPGWLANCAGMQAAIRSRIESNLSVLDEVLDEVLEGSPVSRLLGEGGWYAVLRIPALMPDEEFALELLERTGVLVHPGAAFGFGESGWIVVSLLPEPPVFKAGAGCLISATRYVPITVRLHHVQG